MEEFENETCGHHHQTTLEVVADIAEFAHAVASTLCGYRKILIDGGFPQELADGMGYELHGKLLNLTPEQPSEEEMHFHMFHGDFDENEE